MRLLVCHPGATFSTHDVYVGLANALIERGHHLHTYQLDIRYQRSDSWLHHCWIKAGRPDPRPTHADVIYHASYEALERALHFQVDGVLVISGMFLHPKQLTLMRRAGLRTGVVFTESPYDDAAQYRMAPLTDVCWTNERSSVPILQGANPNTYYLPAAYDPERHRFLDALPSEDVPAHDVVFVGTAFQERVDLLRAVDWTGIDFGLYGSWSTLGSNNKLRRHLRGGVMDNRRAVDLYRRAKIGLNLYRTSRGFGKHAPRIEHAESLNPRAVELAAVGAFQISDRRAEVVEQFGFSVPTFRDADHLGEMLRQYLADDQTRKQYATAARRAVQSQTFAARAAQLEAQLQAAWAQPLAKGA